MGRNGQPKQRMICTQCGVEFWRWISQSGKTPFCSRACKHEWQKGQVPHNKGKINTLKKFCEHCGNLFDAQYKKRQRFCSLACSGRFHSGPNAPNYKNGSTSKRQALIDTCEYQQWRQSVLLRDGNRCQMCLDKGLAERVWPLDVHHIVPIYADESLALVLNNGICLCKDHHLEVTGRECDFANYLTGLLGQLGTATFKQALIRLDANVIRRLVENRANLKAVARHFDVCVPIASRACKEAGVKPYHAPQKTATQYSVLRLAKRGLTAKQIGAELGYDYHWVMWVARRWMYRPFENTSKSRGLTGPTARRLQSIGWSNSRICDAFGVNRDQLRRLRYAA